MLTHKEKRTLPNQIAAYKKLDKDGDMFGESDGKLNKKQHVLNLYQ